MSYLYRAHNAEAASHFVIFLSVLISIIVLSVIVVAAVGLHYLSTF